MSIHWSGHKPRRPWLLALTLLLLAQSAHAQLQLGAAAFGPAFHNKITSDTLALLGFRARRVGVSTYTQQTDLRGSLGLGLGGRRQWLRYRLGNDWIYDSRGQPPFVRQDYRAEVAHVFFLGQSGHWQLGQQLHFDQSRTNDTRTGSWLGRLGYEARLRPSSPGDSLSRFRVTGLVGLADDSRNGHHDSGLAYGFDAAALFYAKGVAAPPLVLRALGSSARLGPRTLRRLLAEVAGETTLLAGGDATVYGRAGYRLNRAEDYLRGYVQRIQSDTIAVQGGYAYRITPFASLRSDNSLLLPTRAFLYRQLEAQADTIQDVGYRQRELDTRQELRLSSTKVQGSISFSYRERRRAYYLDNSRMLNSARLAASLAREQVKDISEKTTLWQGELTWLPVARHAVALLGTAQLLRVDAPSHDNPQTRDEAQHLLRLSWTGRWAGAFRTTLGIAGEFRQTVFIRAALSAENYTDRLLHWEPGFTWAPGRFSVRSNYHLWVSYQVRDRASEQVRNRASRVLEQTQSLTYQLRPRLLVLADYVRRENRLGQLEWPAFRESPLDTSITQDFSLAMRQSWTGTHGTTTLRLGYHLLEQRGYGRATLLPDPVSNSPATSAKASAIYLHQITRQHGPEAAVERRATAGFTLAASLWLQWRRTFSAYEAGTGLPTGNGYLAAELARETQQLVPYFEVTGAWCVGRKPR
jgi:hypothetical protein